MEKEKKIKIILGSIYLLIILIFLRVFFNHFSVEDFTSYELIKANRDSLNEIKNNNIIISSILFFVGTVLWVLLLGFAAPIFLIGGFIFGKWLGAFLVIFGLSIGATFLYILANYFLKDIIEEKFSFKFNKLNEKFKKNELLFFLIYRFVGGIPFFISNILPTLFNVKVKNFFIGSLIGMSPQLFIGVSLGAGLDKFLENNLTVPTFTSLIFTPDIYIPLVGIVVLIILAYFVKKYFFNK
tara:strand:- start:49 stop:768 length:720 start_codon:yes stop_codon:yes gene_type:complete